jgi:hypothetical protein
VQHRASARCEVAHSVRARAPVTERGTSHRTPNDERANELRVTKSAQRLTRFNPRGSILIETF